VIAFIQAGYAVDRILQLTTRGINGVFNRSSTAGRLRAADPDYYALPEALQRVQRSEAIDLRIERRGADEAALVVFRAEAGAEVGRDVRTVQRILRLRQRTTEMNLTFGSVARHDTEIAMLTRSMAEIFMEIAATAQVPPQHLQERRAAPAAPPPALPSSWDEPLVQVLPGPDRPSDAFTAVRYRDHWYWIPDDDMRSKKTFNFVLTLLALAEAGVTPQAPVITVPTN
jgi:hypothetical protein